MQTYTIKPTSAEEYFTAFPAQASKIHGEPTYNDLPQLRAVLYHNAASVHSSLGGGAHGHLSMIMHPTTYATLSPTAWQDPPVPPAQVQMPNNAPTQIQIAAAHHGHTLAVKARQEFLNLDRALTRVIIEAVEPLYLKPFHQPHIGLMGQTVRDIMTKLIDAYGHILPQELQRNQDQLSKPYDATTEPFQVLIDRFEEARTFAADGDLLP